MQVASALNNYIRILFNPKVEAFKLFDFLIAKSDNDRYLAQIVEIYDDKFDSSQNVAKLKLFYKITSENEVMPYDNFTPSKECEIIKIKQDEVESFINQNKETFPFAQNIKNSTPLNIQYDFFDNAVVLADKIENVNSISLTLAQKLSLKRNVIFIDSTGIVDFEDAKKIKASKNFKMPLNYSTIDYVFDRCLKDASLEFQAIGAEIINEIKKFAKKQESNFIPFNAFLRVILEQYKATPFPELKLLLARMKKFQMDEIFAKTKKDKETLFKTVEKNPITIIDLSSVDTYWQKAYLEYITSDIESEVYFIVRVNEDNFDVELINKIYNEKKNIKFIPNVSYNYKKLPSIMQFCKNYILMPSLYQRGDFLDANFALCNLIQDGCVVFGENTNHFLYLVNGYEPQIQEKKINYRKIALTMAGEDGGSMPQTTDSRKLMEELNNFEQEQKIKQESDDNFEAIINDDVNENDPLSNYSNESFEPIENPVVPPEKEINDDFETFDEPDKISTDIKIEQNKETQDEIKDSIEGDFETFDEPEISTDIEIELNSQDETKDLKEDDIVAPLDNQKTDKPETILQEDNLNKEILEDKNEEQSFDDILTKEELDDDEPLDLLLDDIKYEEEFKEEAASNIKQTYPTEDDTNQNSEFSFKGDAPDYNSNYQDKNINNAQTIQQTPERNSNSDNNASNISEEELDFFQIAQQSSKSYENKKPAPENNEDDIDLASVAEKSIDASFEQIVSEKAPVKKDSEKDQDILKQIKNPQKEKENLPIFKEKSQKDKDSFNFTVGDIIVHKKYGRGKVTKTIKYEERQLLQIEFDESGKKLLDPTVADIKPE